MGDDQGHINHEMPQYIPHQIFVKQPSVSKDPYNAPNNDIINKDMDVWDPPTPK
jgi:hypothetical protein